jgi:RNA polymerase sigma-70 factor (ECF subfamily)
MTVESGQPGDSVVDAAISGDEGAFAELTRRHRRELHVHCYRMLASFEDAEDQVQETFLRAWQKRATFERRGSFRSWLYRIATNGCLDFLEKAKKQRVARELDADGTAASRAPEVPWLQPYPDRLLAEAALRSTEPDAKLIARETIELSYIVALQLLPPRQRVALILSDVLDWSAQEVATLLETTVPAANGALRRARATIRGRRGWSKEPESSRPEESAQERALLQQYVAATQRGDAEALVRLLRHDARFSMPPEPGVWDGNRTVVDAWVTGGIGSPPFDDFKCVFTRANRMPAIMSYLKRPGERAYRPWGLDVLGVEGGLITEITTFFGIKDFLGAFALPSQLQ